MHSDQRPLRTIDDVGDYLLQQLHSALRRSGMYGGESALQLYFAAIAFVDGCEQRWEEDLSTLRAREAFISTGVTGAVELALGHQAEDVMASVYAEIAHHHAWLTLDNPLSRADYDHVRSQMRPWCANDRSHSDVLTEFGPPSLLLGGSNPLYPKTFAYGTSHIDDPLVFFHLWNGTEPGSRGTWPPVHPEPLLLAARQGGARFIDGSRSHPQAGADARCVDHDHYSAYSRLRILIKCHLPRS